MRAAISTLSLLILACDPAAQTKPSKAEVEAPAPDDEAKSPDGAKTPDGAESPDGAEAPSEASSGDAAPPEPATGDETLQADPAQSKVAFAVARATTGHVGTFGSFSATLILSAGQPSALDISVSTASVVADRLGLTEHLKSGDFFDVTKFPSATFHADAITPAAETSEDSPATHDIVGTMALHGVEGKLEFPATFVIDDQHVLGTATLDISAKAFGIDYEGMEDELAEDAVALEVTLWFPRAAPG